MARMIDPTIAIGHTHVATLPLDRFDIEPGYNIRIDREELTAHIRSLADSMKARGYDVSRPVTVNWAGDRALIRDGWCRWHAVQLANQEGAGIRGMSAVAVVKGTAEAETLLLPVTSNSGLAPMPFEIAFAVKKALACGWTEDQVAAHCGHSRTWLDGLLRLNGAPGPLREAVVTGEMSSTLASDLMRKGSKQATATLEQARAARPAGTKRITPATVAKVREATTAKITGPRLSAEQKAAIAVLIEYDAWREKAAFKLIAFPETFAARLEKLRDVTPWEAE